MKIPIINHEQFRTKVWDYDSNLREKQFVGERPAVVDFFATWCRPCSTLSPVLETLAKEYNNRIDFYKVDIDKDPMLARAFKVKSIPTLICFYKGGEPQSLVGTAPSNDLRSAMDRLLAKSRNVIACPKNINNNKQNTQAL